MRQSKKTINEKVVLYCILDAYFHRQSARMVKHLIQAEITWLYRRFRYMWE